MSLELSFSKPEGITAKTWSSDTVLLGEYQISMDDFCALTMYVLTNTNLGPDDPRVGLIEQVKKLSVTDGFPTIINGVKSKGDHRLGRVSTSIPNCTCQGAKVISEGSQEVCSQTKAVIGKTCDHRDCVYHTYFTGTGPDL